MFLGASSFIPMKKEPRKEPTKRTDTAPHLMLLDSSITNPSVEVVRLPNPSKLLDAGLYVICENNIFWLRGIQPNIKPVSLFLNNRILNEDCFWATFRFDAICIFTSLLFLNPDKFMSVPQRIYDLYRSGRDDSQEYAALEAGTFALWNHNIDKVQNRLEYLCETIKSDGSKELLFKPNIEKFRAMLEYKVQLVEEKLQKENVMMGAYCETTETSSSNHVRKHHVTFKSGKLRMFAWSIISTMLNDEARRALLPTNCTNTKSSGHIQSNVSSGPMITSKNKLQKKRKMAPVTGTRSITSFFKPS
ncbi:ribonuclease H2 subunit, putative [Babesia ovis]|uniref:Ribonuclease H2 subunit, putative n=1 Tax=Babesia ovis TaxID=5869 RepID=A0A9W5WU54_BABOV|nr:ribonuclease H2 subunit, putative [Babesia ovis]